MNTLTYCKGLPTPMGELNVLGKTQLEMFLSDYGKIFRKASIDTLAHLQSLTGKFDKSAWNTHLQKFYGITKRHAGGIIAATEGRLDSAKECRKNHIQQLQRKLKSAQIWLARAVKKISLAKKFYAKKGGWQASKTGCNFPLSSCLESRKTNWHQLKANIHHKQRYIHKLTQQIAHLKTAPIHPKIPRGDVFVVGSKDESWGNQICQWDGDNLKFRVPYCLEAKYGKFVYSQLGSFDRNIDRLPTTGAKSWHFYRKGQRWVAAVQFTPAPVPIVSRPVAYGCIGIDLNPGSIGWAYVDQDGNLQAQGQIPLQTGLPQGQQDAQIVQACLLLAALANKFACPVVCEALDFTAKKAQLREKSRRYARLLSGWAYSRFFELLESILSNRGIRLFQVNPAYSSLLGLVKYMPMYGLSSDVAAALVIARRKMRLSERLPRSLSAYLGVNPRKHVWSALQQLNIFLKQCPTVNRRHDYYRVSNWGSLVTDGVEQQCRASSKRKR
jgi:IS605 OrfB family transposase